MAVYYSLRHDTIVSTTLDWRIAHGISADFPLLMGTDTVTPPRIHLLRYDVAVDRVVAYVPLLANLALETLDPGAATRKITGRHGDRLPIQVCLDAARREQEVIADVSGLAPEVLAFETDLKGKDFYHSIGDIQTGRFQTGKQYLDAYRSQDYGRLADSDEEWDQHAVAVRHFLRGQPHPTTSFTETGPTVL